MLPYGLNGYLHAPGEGEDDGKMCISYLSPQLLKFSWHVQQQRAMKKETRHSRAQENGFAGEYFIFPLHVDGMLLMCLACVRVCVMLYAYPPSVSKFFW